MEAIGTAGVMTGWLARRPVACILHTGAGQAVPDREYARMVRLPGAIKSDELRLLGQFAKTVFWDEWFAGMAGRIGVVLGFLAYLLGYIPTWTFWTACCLCALVSFYKVWRKGEKAQAVMKQRTAVARELSELLDEGQRCTRQIRDSADTGLPADLFQALMAQWLHKATGYLAEHVSPATAALVRNVAPIEDQVILDMRSDLTRAAKTAVLLQLNAHLNELSRVMREY